jgi:hypothetical protein
MLCFCFVFKEFRRFADPRPNGVTVLIHSQSGWVRHFCAKGGIYFAKANLSRRFPITLSFLLFIFAAHKTHQPSLHSRDDYTTHLPCHTKTLKDDLRTQLHIFSRDLYQHFLNQTSIFRNDAGFRVPKAISQPNQ